MNLPSNALFIVEHPFIFSIKLNSADYRFCKLNRKLENSFNLRMSSLLVELSVHSLVTFDSRIFPVGSEHSIVCFQLAEFSASSTVKIGSGRFPTIGIPKLSGECTENKRKCNSISYNTLRVVLLLFLISLKKIFFFTCAVIFNRNVPLWFNDR